MKKLKPGATVSSITTNYKDTIQKFLGSSDAFSFMSSVKGTPSYWKQFLYDVLDMVKQLGIPTLILTLSRAVLKWDELTSLIHKFNNFTSFDIDLKNLTYEEYCKYLNSNPVLVARHFQYRVQVFFKAILSDSPLGKTSYYVYRVELQVRGTPGIHSFIWIQNSSKLTPETEEEYK